MGNTATMEAGSGQSGRNEVNDEQLFARLIGAAVLLAIAVIALPFVLDGSGSQREFDFAETLPAEPERVIPEKSYSSRQPVQPVPPAESIDVSVPKTTSLIDLSPGIQSQSDGSNLNAAGTGSGQAPAVEVAAKSSLAGTNVARFSEQIPPAGPLNLYPLQSGWNIQVASFVKNRNAVKLINRMRARNLPAYANQVRGSKGPVVRVMVGPYQNQIDALALQNRIDSEYRVESLMLRRK